MKAWHPVMQGMLGESTAMESSRQEVICLQGHSDSDGAQNDLWHARLTAAPADISAGGD